MNKTWLVIDPGGKKFALTYFKDSKPVWMGYHPLASDFEINDMDYFDAFHRVSLNLVSRCEALFIERFISRQAAAKVSAEKLNLMIGTIISIARNQGKVVVAKTSSTWKRTYAYNDCVEISKELGFFKKDKHFVDTILMWCYVHNLQNKYYHYLKLSLGPYNFFKGEEIWSSYIRKLKAPQRKEIQDKLLAIKRAERNGVFDKCTKKHPSKKLALRLCLALANKRSVFS